MVRVMADGREKTMSVGPIPRRAAGRVAATAVDDPDNPPLISAQLAQFRRVPRVKTLRRALGLTQEEFARRYQIPLGTLRDWEQGRTQPDRAALREKFERSNRRQKEVGAASHRHKSR